MRRIELEPVKVTQVTLANEDEPDKIRFEVVSMSDDGKTAYHWSFEVPTWRLEDADIIRLRDRVLDETTDILLVLEVGE